MTLYEVPLSMSMLSFGMGTILFVYCVSDSVFLVCFGILLKCRVCAEVFQLIVLQ